MPKGSFQEKYTFQAPLVSVIFRIEGCQRFVNRTLESILRQTTSDFELILVASSRELALITLSEFSIDTENSTILSNNSPIKYFVCSSVLSAVKLSKGKYLSILCAGDVANENKLELQSGYLDSYSDKNICFCRWLEIEALDASYSRSPIGVMKKMPKAFCPNYTVEEFVPPGTLMFRREVLIRNGKISEILEPQFDDLVPLIDFADEFEIGAIDQALVSCCSLANKLAYFDLPEFRYKQLIRTVKTLAKYFNSDKSPTLWESLSVLCVVLPRLIVEIFRGNQYGARIIRKYNYLISKLATATLYKFPLNRFSECWSKNTRKLSSALLSDSPQLRRSIKSARSISPQIIVSLTSKPDRYPYLNYCLESLLRQTLKPTKIILWLDRVIETSLPNHKILQNQFQSGIELRHCRDLGSYKKFYFALQEYPDALLITVDDDFIYPPYLVEELYESYLVYPHAIHCHRAHLIKADSDGKINPYIEWDWLSNGLSEPSLYLFPTSGAGTLFPPGSLDPEVLNEKAFIRLCPTADDIWLKAMALLRRTPCVKVRPYSSEHIPILEMHSTNTLSVLNVEGGANDAQLKAVFSEYSLDGLL